jgi:ribosome-binding factor A
MLRVVQLVQKELGEIIQKDLEFPGVLISLNSVEVTADLKHCNAFVGVVGSPFAQEEAIAKLHAKRGHLQKRLGDRIRLHQTPQIHFKLDTSIERGVRITNIMNEIDEQIGKDAWKEDPVLLAESQKVEDSDK